MSTFSQQTNRRDALKRLLQAAARGAQEIAAPLAGRGRPQHAPTPPAPTPRRIVPGAPATAAVSHEQLLGWAQDMGLGERLGDVSRLARSSLRATPGQPAGAPASLSKLGGNADLPTDAEWPTWNDERLDFTAQFDLSALESQTLERLPVPGPGLILVFYAGSAPSGLAPAHAGACRAIWVAGDDRGSPESGSTEPDSGRPIQLSHELVLPRPWFSRVRAIGLSDAEQGSWERLRLRLARAQGVEPHDKVDGFLALDRVFAYADERRGDMRLACELLERDVNLEGGAIRAHPRAAEAEDAAGRWELLLQLSRDARTEPTKDAGRDRLYLWLPEDAMRAGEFSGVRAIRQ